MEENTTSSSAPNVSSTQESLVQNPTPPSHKSVYKSKLFIAVVILFIILLLTITASIFANLYISQDKQATNQPTPTPTTQTDSTTGWKIYMNDTYGYSFKYPSSWFVFSLNKEWNRIEKFELELDPVYISIYNLDGSIDINGIPDGIYISHPENSKQLAAEDYVKQIVIPDNNKNLENIPLDIIKNANIETKNIRIEKSNLGNTTAVIVYGLNNVGAGFGNHGPEVYISHPNFPNRIIRIVSSNHFNNDTGSSENFLTDQILSTFKFADSNSQSEYFSCKNQEFENNPLAGISALEAYCMGQLCIGETQSACINHEVLDLESMGYPEQANQSDCVWQNNTCYPRY